MAPQVGKYRDVCIAACLLLSSFALAAFSYRRIYLLQPATSFTFGSLQEGSSEHLLYQGDSCIGTLNVLQERLELVRLRAEARIMTQLQGQRLPLRIAIEGFFNPLGQLVRSSLDVSFLTSRLIMTTTDVHPLHVHLYMVNGGARTEREIDLPGPIVLKGAQSTGLSLDYPGMAQFLPVAERLIAFPEARSIEARLVPEARACSPEGAFDLSSLALSSLPFANQLRSFVEQQSFPEKL